MFRRRVQGDVDPFAEFGGLEIELRDAGSVPPGESGEGSRGLNDGTRPDHEEDVTSGRHLTRAIQYPGVERFAEPDDGRTHQAAAGTVGEVTGGRTGTPILAFEIAVQATDAPDAAVQFDDLDLRAVDLEGIGMESVDVLRQDGDRSNATRELDEGGVRTVRFGGSDLVAPPAVPFPDQCGVIAESLGGGELHGGLVLPHPVGATKCRDATGRRNAGPGEHADPGFGSQVGREFFEARRRRFVWGRPLRAPIRSKARGRSSRIVFHSASVDRRTTWGQARTAFLSILLIPVLAWGQSEPRLEILERAMIDDVEQAYVTYPSGKLLVTGWLFVHPFSANDVEPGLIFNHGGVGGVTEGTRALCRRLAKEGFVVFAPSYRGEDDSEGEIEIAMGEVDDVVNAVLELRKHPGIRPDRFVMVGTSHGALISLKAAARSELCGVVRAIVPAYGVMDIYAWYQHLLDNDFDVRDPLSLRIYGDGPKDKPQAFADRHAINFIDDLCPTTPIFVVQGAKDLIVPEAQAHTMAAALAGRGRVGDRMEVYREGGHGFLYWDDPENRTAEQLADTERAWSDILDFLRSHLEDEETSGP